MTKAALHLPLVLLFGSTLAASGLGSDIPGNLVVDVRIYEARSQAPDFQAMENLSFFIDTDGEGITEEQWLATIARQVPESILAVLASETVEVEDSAARFSHHKRSRSFEVSVDLKDFLERGTFAASTQVRLVQGDETVREFDREIELRLGQTYVWAGRNLELSASEYLSHFRDYDDTEHRGELYEWLRDFTFFLVLAVTPRLEDSPAAESEPVALSIDGRYELPEVESAVGVALVGEIELELELDSSGAPADVAVRRTSAPELTPRVLGEVSSWQFPEASGRRGRLKLSLRADP